MTSKGKGPKQLVARDKVDRPKPYVVSLTASAESVYRELREQSQSAEQRDGHSSSQHCTTFRMVDEAIRKLIPADPTNTKYALHAPLNMMYRIAKGRTRIAWVVEPKARQILIIYISDTPRKEGDIHDPYVVLGSMMKSGHLNHVIEQWRQALAVPPDASVH